LDSRVKKREIMKYLNTILIGFLGASIGEANCSHEPQDDPSLNPVNWRKYVNQQPEPDVQPMDLEDDDESDDAAEMARVMEMLRVSSLKLKGGK